MENISFHCTHCGKIWRDREEFLSDSSVNLCGYQVNFFSLQEGLFLFTHMCGTTFSYSAGVFQDLYNGPVFRRRMCESDECQGYCTQREELRVCPVQCECAYVREVLQIIHTWPKTF